MKKIGIVSCYYVKNYGSMLQAYAVQKLLDDKKIENENINYIKIKDKKQLILYIKRLCNKNIRKVQFKFFEKRLIGKINKNKYGINFQLRNKKFEEFKNKYIRVSNPYYGYQKLKEGAKNYKAFLLGSDQVWNPDNLDNHYFTLEFIPDEIPKITYAPSFGVSTIPKKQIEKTKSYLKRIEYISVREKSGQKIVQELINREVPVVLDPTLMLSREKWDEIQPKERLYNKKYIFCYFLGNSEEHRKWVKKIKEKTGYDIIALPHIDEIVKIDDEYADIKMYDIGPGEMINLIKYAELIFTDSFHCTAFSVIYNKNFFTFNRFSHKDKNSTNTRLKSILSILDLENRLITNYNECEKLYKQNIDFTNANKILAEMQRKSFEYLDDAIDSSLK